MADSDVEKIKDKLSINEVVGQYVQLRRAGRNFTARCPFHKEKTPSFFVSPERGTYICFGCGEKGDIFSFVQKIDGVDFPTALKQLAEKAGVTLTSREGSRRSAEDASHIKEKGERLREVCEEATKFFEAQLAKKKDVHEYVRARGVKDETVASWRLGYAPASWEDLSAHLVAQGFSKDEIVEAGLAVKSEKKPGEIFDRFRGRIIFPLFDQGGAVIAFSGRFFEDMPRDERKASSEPRVEPAKYINSPETLIFKKSRVLYGLDRAKNAIRRLDCILLVEGQFDLIMCHQSGLPFTVALSGTALTDEHLSLLGRFSKRLVLALDADAAGIRAGLKSTAMALAQGFDVKVPTFPEGKDPADIARENPELLKAAIRTSQTAIEFFLDVMRRGAKDERAYKKAVEVQVLPLLAMLQSSIDQEHFVRIVASRLQVSESAVRTEAAKKPHQSGGGEDTPSAEEQNGREASLEPLEKKIGMLLFYFDEESPARKKLEDIVGSAEAKKFEAEMAPQAERLRFMFDAELGEHTTAEVVAEDMLTQIKRQKDKETFKTKFL